MDPTLEREQRVAAACDAARAQSFSPLVCDVAPHEPGSCVDHRAPFLRSMAVLAEAPKRVKRYLLGPRWFHQFLAGAAGVRPPVVGDENRQRVIKAPVSDAAYEGWHAWSKIRGASLAALLESVGLALHERPDANEFSRREVDRIVTRARELTAERRRKV